MILKKGLSFGVAFFCFFNFCRLYIHVSLAKTNTKMLTEEQYNQLEEILKNTKREELIKVMDKISNDIEHDALLKIHDDIMRQIESLIEFDKPFDQASWGYEDGVLLKGDDALLVVKFICKYL